MKPSASALSLLLFILVLTPSSSAAWSIGRSYEPDTREDREGHYQWHEPPPENAPQRIYFNVIPQDRTVPGAPHNPNVGALQSRVLPATQLSFTAWLGVWVDCNKDGYVGLGDQGVLAYRFELLADVPSDSRCSHDSDYVRKGWVLEFIAVGPYSRATGLAPVLHDDRAAVWGDFGKPTDPAYFVGCQSVLAPSGSTTSTGGLLGMIDCRLGYRGVAIVNEPLNQTGLGLGFDDPHHPERDCDAPLNQPVPEGTYGDDPCSGDVGTLEAHPGGAALTVWDCRPTSAPWGVRDPHAPPGERGGWSTVGAPEALGYGGDVHLADSEGYYVRVAAVEGPQLRPSGSWRQAAEDLAYGARGCTGQSYTGVMEVESDESKRSPTDGKRVPDFEFVFHPQTAGAAVAGVQVGRSLIPENLGLRPYMQGHWSAQETYGAPGYLGPTFRQDLTRPAGGWWFTFYGHVSHWESSGYALNREGALSGIYGADACGDWGQGVHHGWDCDESHWWNPAWGTPEHPDRDSAPRPGMPYYMRDVDCYDGRFIGTFLLGASLAWLSPEAQCPPGGPL